MTPRRFLQISVLLLFASTVAVASITSCDSSRVAAATTCQLSRVRRARRASPQRRAGANDAARYIAGEFARLGLNRAWAATRLSRTRRRVTCSSFRMSPVSSWVSRTRTWLVQLRAAAAFCVGEDWMPLGVLQTPSLGLDRFCRLRYQGAD